VGRAEEAEEEEGGNASCSVLEWRLIGRFDQGGVAKSILTGRSCSICGWVGCEKCEREMECPAWLGGGTVKYLDDPDRLDDADVVLVPATGDLGNFDIPKRIDLMDDQRIVAIAGEVGFRGVQPPLLGRVVGVKSLVVLKRLLIVSFVCSRACGGSMWST
jgi:hypothetical protein